MATKITILGAGPGGYVAAIRAAQRGASVTVVERAEVGGTCLNQGCIPTKTLMASAEAYAQVRKAADFGIELNGEAAYNLARIRERKDKVVATQVSGIRSLFKSWGVSLIPASGSLLSPGVVRAVQQDGTTHDIKSDKIIIATGSRPARLPGFPFDGERVLTSDDAVQFKKIPKSLLIIGAGVIGCEFAFLYRTFGAEVTMIEMMPRALSTEDSDISDIIERELKKAKIKLLPNSKIEHMSIAAEGMVSVSLSDGTTISAEQALVSIGRSLNTEDLGLDEAGVQLGKRGEIVVNERMETSAPGVYAVGDVTAKWMLAHVASQQGLVAVENALGGDDVMQYDAVAAGIFTMPEAGTVGLREHQAVEKKIAVRIGRFPYRALGRSHTVGAISGIVKVIADAKTDKVLGVHACGAHATDLVHEGALAIMKGVTAKELGSMIHAHPTFSEGLREAAEDVHGQAIHLPKPAK